MYKKWSPTLKAKVALEALMQNKTISELSKETGAHPNMISRWRDKLIENAIFIFNTPSNRSQHEFESEIDDLYKQIGLLYSENYNLKKTHEK